MLREEHATARTVIICVTIVLLGGIGALAHSCDRIDERREKCIAAGKSADDCRRLYNLNDSRSH